MALKIAVLPTESPVSLFYSQSGQSLQEGFPGRLWWPEISASGMTSRHPQGACKSCLPARQGEAAMKPEGDFQF